MSECPDERVGETVFHAVRAKRFLLPNGGFSNQMFLLRERDTDGLSVDVLSARSAVGTLTVYGVASLPVMPIYEIGLEVEVDDYPHAFLKGMVQQADNPGLAEFHASQLADMAQAVDAADWQ